MRKAEPNEISVWIPIEWNGMVFVCCSNKKEISCYLRDQFIVTWKWLDKHLRVRTHARTHIHGVTTQVALFDWAIQYGQIHIELFEFSFYIFFTFIFFVFRLYLVSFIDCPIFRSFALWLKDPNKYVYINCNPADQLNRRNHIVCTSIDWQKLFEILDGCHIPLSITFSRVKFHCPWMKLDDLLHQWQ